MAEVNGNTVITMTLTQLVTGVVLFAGALWLVSTFTLGNLKSDVSDIRNALTETQDRNADTHQNATSADGELREQIAGLTAELKVTNAGLTGLNASVTGLNGSVKAVDERLAASVARQEQFETWVVTRLGVDDRQPMAVPLDWQKQQGDIFTKIRAGSDPLLGWFQAVGTLTAPKQ